jgi:hypothetical protein
MPGLPKTHARVDARPDALQSLIVYMTGKQAAIGFTHLVLHAFYMA